MSRARVDICLLLEGTYPFVQGGVSSWVHQLISELSELSFGLIFLGSSREAYGKARYTLPDNVAFLDVHYLFDSHRLSEPRARRGSTEVFARWSGFTDYCQRDESMPEELLIRVFHDMVHDQLPREDFLFSRASWSRITEFYLEHCRDTSFVDFFWSYRNLYGPLLAVAPLTRDPPAAGIYHSISTGYAGLLGALLRLRTGRPFVLTEHGIYTKERSIDLAQADWIRDRREAVRASDLSGEVGPLKRIWIRFFEQLGRIAYDHSECIISLYRGNQARQIRDGAPAERTRVIPNGVNLQRFSGALESRPAQPPRVAALIGRVVPIKDVKTFIRAIQHASHQMPDLQGWIVGPTDEDEDYATECQQLVESLRLEKQVHFLGSRDVAELLPGLGVVVLTSISEAQPLVILEAMAAGVPSVGTDVGAIRELVEGGSESDRELGSCGAVVNMAAPAQTAEAIVGLLSDPQRWTRAQQAGLARVRAHYDERQLFRNYRNLYREALQWRA